MRRPPGLLAALVLSLTALTACTGGDTVGADAGGASPDDQLPPAEQLLASAATELSTVRTARFAIAVEGAADALGIRSADGVITSAGDAEGAAQLDQAGTVVELSFVVIGGTLHVKGLTGGWQELPLAMAASVYDPSAILDPDRGAANLVRTATGTTEERETLDGVRTYRVRAELSGVALGALVPGVTTDVTGTLWIGTDRPLLHRVSFPAQGQDGSVAVTFSEFDAPVTISAPEG